MSVSGVSAPGPLPTAPALPTPPLPFKGTSNRPLPSSSGNKRQMEPFHLLRCSLHCGSSLAFILGSQDGARSQPADGPQPRARDTCRMWPTGLRCLDSLSPGTSGPRKYHTGTLSAVQSHPCLGTMGAGCGLRQILFALLPNLLASPAGSPTALCLSPCSLRQPRLTVEGPLSPCGAMTTLPGANAQCP